MPVAVVFRCLLPIPLLIAALPTHAVIVRGDDENPLPAAVAGAESAGSWVAELRDPGTPGSLATPIGPRHFLTAAHLEFAAGDPLWFRGVRHTVVGRRDLPDSDLAVGEVTPEFPFHVELYPRDDEVRRPLLVLGKGRWKGEPVLRGGELRGWRYGESGTPGIRWGTNRIEKVVVADADAEGLKGDYLVADFDGDAGDDEAHFTRGDSGSPVFIQDCGLWKLAGVASAVEGPFVPADDLQSEPFLAALFDVRGFVVAEGEGAFRPMGDPGRPVPSSWFAARVSSRVAELRSAVGLPAVPGVPEPADRIVWAEPTLTIPIGVLTQARAEAGVNDSAPAAAVSVVCVDDRSGAGGSVVWFDQAIRYTAPAAPGSVDSFRYVVGAAGSGGSAWGRVVVVSKSLATARPRVAFDADGAVVVVWPVASAAGPAGSAPRVERATSAAGPWHRFDAVVTRLDDWYLFAGRPETEPPGAACFRLVFE